MKYLEMRPEQVREAIKNNVPVILPLGVIEYHGEHLPLGVDSFVAIETINRVEKRHPEIVVLPPFYYGAASLAVAKPEGNGSIQVDAEKLIPVAEEIFSSLLRVGFRNIRALICHQTEEFAQGMPTDLAFRFAARHTIFNWLEKNVCEGWWGTEEFSSYYSGGNNPFNWIQIYGPRMSKEDAVNFPGDHAGKTETSEAMWMYPECVDMSKLDNSLWFCRPAKDATPEYGDACLEAYSRGLERLLFGDKA